MGGSSSRISRNTSVNAAAFTRSRVIGVLPVSSSYSSAPRAYTSARVSTSRAESSACSGAMYSSVPITAPISVYIVRSASLLVSALATPKSITFGTGLPSWMATSTFVGLMSRWMTPFWWACCTAEQTATNSPSRSRIDKCSSSQYFVIGTPLTSSIAKYGRPAGVIPASNTLAMLVWSIRARACRSASNRATTRAESIPGLISFRATRRLTGCSCSTTQTSPIPPSPSCWSSLYGPIRPPISVPAAGLSAVAVGSGSSGHSAGKSRVGSVAGRVGAGVGWSWAWSRASSRRRRSAFPAHSRSRNAARAAASDRPMRAANRSVTRRWSAGIAASSDGYPAGRKQPAAGCCIEPALTSSHPTPPRATGFSRADRSSRGRKKSAAEWESAADRLFRNWARPPLTGSAGEKQQSAQRPGEEGGERE